jgi:hypothetical protein
MGDSHSGSPFPELSIIAPATLLPQATLAMDGLDKVLDYPYMPTRRRAPFAGYCPHATWRMQFCTNFVMKYNSFCNAEAKQIL